MTNEPRFNVEQMLFPSSAEQRWWALCGKLGVLGSDGRGICVDARLEAPGTVPLRFDIGLKDDLAGMGAFVGIVSDPGDGARHIAMAGVSTGVLADITGMPDTPMEPGWKPEIGFRDCVFDHREDGLWVTAGTIGYLNLGSRPALVGTRFGFGEPPWTDAGPAETA